MSRVTKTLAMARADAYSEYMTLLPPPMPEFEEVHVPRQSDVTGLLAEYQDTACRMALFDTKLRDYGAIADGDTVRLPVEGE